MKMEKMISKLTTLFLFIFGFSIPMVGALGNLSTFSDVPLSHQNYTAITDLKTRGIISGYPDGTFKPNQDVNRVEALKIISLGAGGKTATTSSQRNMKRFSDIEINAWYIPYLDAAVQNKIVDGYPDGTFKPTQTVNLVENLKMLFQAKGIDLSTVVVTADPYKDGFKDQWYAKYLQYAKDKKIIDADVQGNIYPARGMTRAKLAEMLYRLIYIQEKGLDYYGQVKKETVIQNPAPPSPGAWYPSDNVLTVNIQNFAFNKNEMTIGVGTKVRWINKDAMIHNVTSDTNDFQSNDLASSQTFEYTFNKQGTYLYHCSLHPNMKGKIIVKPAIEVPTI